MTQYLRTVTQTIAIKATDKIKKHIKEENFDEALRVLHEDYQIDLDTLYTKNRYVLYLLVEDCGNYIRVNNKKATINTVKFIKLFLDSGKIDINHQDKYGLTLLIRACDFTCPECVQLFLDYGADPNIRGINGEGALGCALYQYYRMTDVKGIKRSISCLNILMQHGADPDLPDALISHKFPNVPTTMRQSVMSSGPLQRLLRLSCSATLQSYDIAYLSATVEKDSDLSNSHVSYSVASHAITRIRPFIIQGKIHEAVKLLNNLYGINFDSKLPNDSYFLSWLFNEVDVSGTESSEARRNLFSLYRLFLDSGIDVNHRDHYGHTLLANAIWERSIEQCQLLLDYGADLNIVNNDNRTPLSIAIRSLYCDFGICNKKQITETLSFLTSNGARITDEDNEYVRIHSGKDGDFLRKFFEGSMHS